jgi:hypothetical protein
MTGERAAVGDVVVRIYDRGPEPEWHTDRTLFGPWYRYEAELDAGGGGASELGMSPWAALYGLVANHRSIAPAVQEAAR